MEEKSRILKKASSDRSRAITFDELVISYSEQIEALIDGGVHILLVETIFSIFSAVGNQLFSLFVLIQ